MLVRNEQHHSEYAMPYPPALHAVVCLRAVKQRSKKLTDGDKRDSPNRNFTANAHSLREGHARTMQHERRDCTFVKQACRYLCVVRIHEGAVRPVVLVRQHRNACGRKRKGGGGGGKQTERENDGAKWGRKKQWELSAQKGKVSLNLLAGSIPLIRLARIDSV